MRNRSVTFALAALMLSGCGTASEAIRVSTSSIAVETQPVLDPPVIAADPLDRTAQTFIGPWTLARSGDRVCEVDLGSRNAAGRFAAKTRRCTSVELARIATWQPLPDGVVLYDFEDRPVVTLVRAPTGFFEGPLSDGTRLTLWR